METELAAQMAELRKSEGEKTRLVESARQKREQILKQALEETKHSQEKALEDSTRLKNELLSQARKEIDAEVAQLVRQAQKEAEKLSAKTLGAGTVQRIAGEILG